MYWPYGRHMLRNDANRRANGADPDQTAVFLSRSRSILFAMSTWVLSESLENYGTILIYNIIIL